MVVVAESTVVVVQRQNAPGVQFAVGHVNVVVPYSDLPKASQAPFRFAWISQHPLS